MRRWRNVLWRSSLKPNSARVMSVNGSMVVTLMRTDTMTDQDACALCTRGVGEGWAHYVPHHQHTPRPRCLSRDAWSPIPSLHRWAVLTTATGKNNVARGVSVEEMLPQDTGSQISAPQHTPGRHCSRNASQKRRFHRPSQSRCNFPHTSTSQRPGRTLRF